MAQKIFQHDSKTVSQNLNLTQLSSPCHPAVTQVSPMCPVAQCGRDPAEFHDVSPSSSGVAAVRSCKPPRPTQITGADFEEGNRKEKNVKVNIYSYKFL